MFFEELGFRYFGPLDGHNLALLIPSLKNILNIKGPRLLHVITKKGKGYAPSENDPVRFHSAGPFDVSTGKSLVKKEPQPMTYTEVFSKKLVELAATNKKIVAITAAMAEGTGLDKFRDAYPERFFDVGIAEAHAVCFSGGLARGGSRPVVAVYSSFLQRAYDQIVEEVALQNAPVVFAIDRAGIVGEDGPTHQGVFDIAFLKNIPNLVVMAPKDGRELEAMLEFALTQDKPVSIRYPKSNIPSSGLPVSAVQLGKAELLKDGKDIVIIALGSMVLSSLFAAEILQKEGFDVAVINSRFVKPLDEELINKMVEKAKFILTVEEGVLEGGFGSAIREAIDMPVARIGIPSEFTPHGKRDIVLEKYGLTAEGIARRVLSVARADSKVRTHG
jgi:1-deoxy-D-xylulose-5-phosphate synthase